MSEFTTNILSEQVLDKTMRLFWEKGYFNTSIEDIIDVTGVNRAALYKHFDGKRGLFLAMLERFRGNVVQEATTVLRDPSCSIDGLKSFFTQFIQQDNNMISTHGCFLIATASDIPSHDDEVAVIINDFISHIRMLFYKILKHKLNSNYDPKAIANFLVCNLLGLLTLFRSGADKTIARYHVQTVNQFLANLQQGKSQ